MTYLELLEKEKKRQKEIEAGASSKKKQKQFDETAATVDTRREGTKGYLDLLEEEKQRQKEIEAEASRKAAENRAKYDDIAPVEPKTKLSFGGYSDAQKLESLLSVYGSKDFKANSGYVSTESDRFWDKLSSKYGLGYNDLQYEYINNKNNIRDEISQRAMSWGSDSGKTTSSYEEKALDFMTADEVAVYNYYYNKEGKDKAQEFLDALAETLNARKAGKEFSGIQGKTAAEILFGVEAGHHQFEQGVKNLPKMITGKDDYIAQTSTQILTGMVREDLADRGPTILGNSLGQVAFDTVTTASNMAPSILTSFVVSQLNPVAGQVVGNALMGGSAAGNAYQQVLNQGYDKDSARLYSTLIGTSEAALQYALGGIGKLGGTSATISRAVSGIENGLLRFALEFGGKIGSEAVEEGLQEVLDPLFKNAVLGTDESVDWENVAYSALLGGIMGAGFGASEVKTNHFTNNEAAVVKKETENRIAEAEAKGTKLTTKEKNAIHEQVEKDLESGYISTDTIESVLAGDSQKAYDSLLKESEEFNTLYETEGSKLSEKQKDRLAELKQKNTDNPYETALQAAKEKISQDAFEIAKGDRLAESYFERERKKQAFTADTSQYKNENARQTVQNVIDSGIANNTKKFHSFVDLMAKVSEEKGLVFNVTNAQKLQGTKYMVDGKAPNGFIEGNQITINLSSPKNIDFIAGHEITHSLEQAGLYKDLQKAVEQYARTKGEYDSRLASLTARYEGKGDPSRELVADMIGDYVFTDADFVRNLSVSHRNVFQKIYDEIKYLWKVATAGSKEARELERVKKLFEEAYREGENTRQSEEISDSKTKYSIREEAPPKNTGVAYKVFYVKDGKLYPPMVANPDGADTPMGVWLNADVGTAAPPSKTGRAQVKAGGKGTQGGSGSLAFRPGWHLGDLPRASQFDRVNPETGKKELFPENFVWAEVEYAKDVDYQEEAMSYGYTDNGKFRHAYAGLPRLPENGYYRYRTNPKPDTVPWVITGAMKVNRLLSDAEVNEILQKNGVDPVHRQGGDVGLDKFGFGEDGTVKYSLSDEQQEYFKDSVVRDENGNLKVMYHGTSKGGHTVFDTYGSNYGLFGTGSYFTDSKTIAESYTKKGKGKNPQVYEAYLNIKNPMDMDAEADPAQWAKVFPEADFPESGTNKQFYRAVEEYYADQYMPKWEVAEEIQGGIESGMGYDGITHIGGGRVNPDGERHRVYIAFQPEQIKNTDNAKPTDHPDIRYSLSELENAYQYNIDNNDMLGAEMLVERAANLAMPNSKIRGKDGSLKPVYHGTREMFYEFDTSISGGKNGTAEGFGIYTSDDPEVTEVYGERQIKMYANITKPATSTKKTITASKLAALIKDTCKRQAQKMVADGEYDTTKEALLDTWVSNYVYTYDIGMDRAYRETANSILQMNDNDMAIIQEVMSGMSIRDYAEATDFYRNSLTPITGFDGFVTQWENKSIGKKSNIILAFDSSQLKSADAVTRDNAGNVIPLSERFNPEKTDIRYSLSEDTDGNKLTEEQEQYFRKSKMRDDNGNLKPMYHGTKDGGFHVFDRRHSDDHTSFFFVDSNDVASSYSGTSETYSAQSFRTAEDFNKFFAEIGAEEYEVREQDGKFHLYEDGDFAAESDTAEGIYEEFRDWSGLGYGDVNYKVYLNLENPLEVDAGGNEWSEIPIPKKHLAKFNETVYLTPDPYGYIGTATTRNFADYANTQGYDGVIFKNILDVGGYGGKYKPHTVAIAFDSSQIKSVANKTPTTNADIRYSKEGSGKRGGHGEFSIPAREFLREQPTEAIAQKAQAEIAPVKTEAPTVAENATVSNMENVAPVVQPVQEELFPDSSVTMESLMEEQDGLRNALEAAADRGDYETMSSLTADYEAVTKQIQQMQASEDDRISSLSQTDAPPEVDAPYPGESGVSPAADPFADRDMSEVGNRSVKAYQYENPEVRPYFMDAALGMLGDLHNGVKGERWFNDDVYYESGGEKGFGGTKRQTTADIAELLDQWNYSYAEIEKGLNAIIEDNGKENNACSKRIEFMLHDRLVNGYTGVWGEPMPANQEYINFLEEKQINEYSQESFAKFMETADQYAPPAQEEAVPVKQDIAPTAPLPYDLKGAMKGQETHFTPEYNLNNRQAQQGVAAEDIAPLYDAAARKGVPEGQQAFMEDAGVPKTVTRKELHAGIIDNIKASFAQKGFNFDEVLKKAKNLSTPATVDNTPQRVMEKALGYKEGGILSDITVNKVAQNETEGIRWLNSFTDRKNGLLASISRRYNIKPGSKESAAAQMYAEGFYVNEQNEIISYGDKELAADFPDTAKQAQIKGLASDPRIRKIYDDTLKAINESRTRNAYPEIPRLDNYFLHFRAMEDTFSTLGLPFNPNDIRAKDLPTDLNGVTADLKPGQPYFASAQHRTGKRTSFDLLGGLERYLNSAKNQIYHIDDIQNLRALRNYIADTYGQANGLEGLDALSEEAQQERIEQVYGSHLSTFAKFLNEEANVIAGKTALIDRGLEGVIGRRGMTFLDTVNRQVGANMVGYNVSSSLTNFLAPVQAFAKSNKAAFIKGMAQFASNKVRSVFGSGDGFAEQSPVMIRRKGAERFHRTPWQKMSDPGYILMGAVDNVSTELIARAKYNELVGKGMDSQQAHIETDKWVSRLMGDRSLGQQPQLFNSKTLGIVTKFQLEVRNQLDSQFYDTIQETKVSNEYIQNALLRNAKTAAKVTSTFVQLAVAQHLFGKAFESIAGYNPAFDIISAIIKTFGWDDDEESEDTVLDNIEQGFFELMEDMPYVSTFTGGRIPISSALPIAELYKGEDQYGNEKSRLETLAEAAPYYFLPGGYGQLKKTTAGLKMFGDEHPVAGSYTDSGNLRFPVEDTLANRAQAAVFGQWASDNARYYFDNEISPLKEKQIQEYMDTGMPIRDYWDYREGLKGLDNLSEQADYINSLDVPIATKNTLINNLTDRKEPINLAGYDNFGSFEEFDFATKNPEKYEIAQAVGGYESYATFQDDMKNMKLEEKVDYVAGLNLTTEQKNILINGETDRKEPIDLTGYENFGNFEEFEYAKENPEKYAVAKSVGGYEAYKAYSGELYDIKADKDENGKSISGSRKEKVLDYINGLDIDYGMKLILFKNEYNADDTYNYEIVQYLDSREDISWQDMKTILTKLGFTVHDDGRIEWD